MQAHLRLVMLAEFKAESTAFICKLELLFKSYLLLHVTNLA